MHCRLFRVVGSARQESWLSCLLVLAETICTPPTHTHAAQEELAQLKALWDMAGSVLLTVQQWHSTRWGSIDTEALMEQVRLQGLGFSPHRRCSLGTRRAQAPLSPIHPIAV